MEPAILARAVTQIHKTLGNIGILTADSSTNGSITSPATVSVAVSAAPKIVSNLCEVIGTATSQTHVLGDILDRDSRQYRIDLFKIESASEEIYVSLKKLFEERSRLVRKYRLQLAVTLASLLLQLHETARLSKNLDKSSILFELQCTQEERTGVFANKPFVSCSLPLSTHYPTSEETTRPTLNVTDYRNQSVFALGILLIELWFRSSLERLRITLDMGADGNPNTVTDLVTARRLLEHIYSEAGDWYGDAVRRCIFCEFNQRHTSLENPSFKGAVDRDIIQPPVNHLSSFSGRMPILCI